MRTREPTDKDRKIIQGVSQILLDALYSINDSALEEQVLNNIIANWLSEMSDRTQGSIEEWFRNFTNHLNDEILFATKLSKENKNCSIEIDRKEDK